MTEQQNLDVVRSGYEAFGSGDIPGLLRLFHDDVSWITPGPADLPTAGTRNGHEAVQEFFVTLTSVVDILRFEPKDFIAHGDKVIVIGDDTNTSQGHGERGRISMGSHLRAARRESCELRGARRRVRTGRGTAYGPGASLR